MYLTYSSARAPGFDSTIAMQLVPGKMPKELRLVKLNIDVAGVHFEKTLEARPNLTFTHGWNKRNVYTHAVYGLTDVKSKVSGIII